MTGKGLGLDESEGQCPLPDTAHLIKLGWSFQEEEVVELSSTK